MAAGAGVGVVTWGQTRADWTQTCRAADRRAAGAKESGTSGGSHHVVSSRAGDVAGILNRAGQSRGQGRGCRRGADNTLPKVAVGQLRHCWEWCWWSFQIGAPCSSRSIVLNPLGTQWVEFPRAALAPCSRTLLAKGKLSFPGSIHIQTHGFSNSFGELLRVCFWFAVVERVVEHGEAKWLVRIEPKFSLLSASVLTGGY